MWAGPIVAATVIALIKVSTLVLFQRIFIIPKFRLACNIMIGLTAGWFLASVFVSISLLFTHPQSVGSIS